MTDSPYLFPAAAHPLQAVTERLKVREAVSGFGIALRYQERAPDPPVRPSPHGARPAIPSSSWPAASATRSTTTASRPGRATCCTSPPAPRIVTSRAWWAMRWCATC